MQNVVVGYLSLVRRERMGWLHTESQIPLPGTVVLNPSWLDSAFHLPMQFHS